MLYVSIVKLYLSLLSSVLNIVTSLFTFTFTGKVSLAQHLLWIEPATDSDKDLAEIAMQASVSILRMANNLSWSVNGYPRSQNSASRQ